jgi:HAD superfamily hydrolase (TIGR01549 family)
LRAAAPVKVRGAIWDVDGTLVNSNDAHARAWVSALAESDVHVSFEAVRPLIGMGGDKLLPAIAQIEHDSTLGRAIVERRSRIFESQYLPNLRSCASKILTRAGAGNFPRARELLLRLTGAGVSLAVASSAKEADVAALLKLAHVEDLFVKTTSSDDAAKSKPDPDIVQAALDGLKLEPADVVMIGDTPYDLEAARRVGIRAIALRCGGRSDAELADAVAIYDSPADLLEHFGSSPFGGGRH